MENILRAAYPSRVCLKPKAEYVTVRVLRVWVRALRIRCAVRAVPPCALSPALKAQPRRASYFPAKGAIDPHGS